MNEILKLVGNAKGYYKGGYGLISRDIYVRRDDTNNNIYSASNLLYRGSPKESDELVYIKNPAQPFLLRMSLEHIELPKEGIFLLFRKDYIYVLDFTLKEYCKYPRFKENFEGFRLSE